jgi:hypothetical protein
VTIPRTFFVLSSYFLFPGITLRSLNGTFHTHLHFFMVTEKARNLLSCNLRMEKALQTVCEESSQSEIPTTATKSLHLISGAATLPVSTILKGIPKALLEKVCAFQNVCCIVLDFIIGSQCISYSV